MVEIGSVIRAKVDRVMPYGLFLSHNDETAFVVLPEVSWKPIKNLSDVYHPGDTVDVQVLRYNYPEKMIVGSIRRLRPEENPYRQLSRLAPDTVLQGTVGSEMAGEVVVRLANGASGFIPKYRLPAEIHAGDAINVTIAALEVDEGRLTLDVSAHSRVAADQATAEARNGPAGLTERKVV